MAEFTGESRHDIVNGIANGETAKEDPLLIEAMGHLDASDAKHFEDEEAYVFAKTGHYDVICLSQDLLVH
jgi:hypothetical protein